MSQSLVRISLQARKNDTFKYQTAVNEFVEKMGGAENVLRAIGSYKGEDADGIIISFHRDPIIRQSEETIRCM